MTTLAHHEVKRNAQSSNHENQNQILELEGPKRYSVQGLAEMAQPDRECPEGMERFYAVAQIDAVESTGPTAEENEEVRLVLYVNADVSRCVERVFNSRTTSFERMPRISDIDPEHENIGEPSARTREKYAPVVGRHRELDGQEVQDR